MTYPAQKTSPSPGGSPWRLPQLRHRVAIPLVTVLLVATVGRLLVVSPEITHGETALLEGLVQYRNAALIAVITGWLAVFRRKPLDATAFLITSLMGWAAIGLVKVAAERPRPSLMTGDQLLALDGATSFPSGHTGGALAIVLALTLVNFRSSKRNRILLFGLAAVAVVGMGRIYATAHYPLDVLVSIPVAWAGVMIGCSLSNALVPALAYGFGWTQKNVTVPAPKTARTSTSATGANGATAASSWEAPAKAQQSRPAFDVDEAEEDRAA
ncbi:MAG: phosphatase PAP2 family protein [Bifidobacterium sp.]|nr:phosphatase PAP2 family protein [Bifidobacterium sp.]